MLGRPPIPRTDSDYLADVGHMVRPTLAKLKG